MLPLRRALPPVLIALFGWMALSVGPHVGITADEPVHLTSGYAYWTTGDYRFQPENGNLPQRWAALPLLFESVTFPATGPAWVAADVWHVSRDFFFRSHNDTARMVQSGRAMIMLFGLALAALCFGWSRSLFGWGGGLVTLGFVVFCPSLLAHTALITSDLAATLGFMLALLTWWRLCHRLTLGRIAAAGLAAAVLALSKYSALLFAPMAVVIFGVRLARGTPLPWRWWRCAGRLTGIGRALALVTAGLAAVMIMIGLIWAAYGFRYAASDPARPFVRPWSEVLITQPQPGGSVMADGRKHDPFILRRGIVEEFTAWARNHQILPEAYLYGLAFTDLHARGRLAYFAGDYRETGWWDFFPLAFLLKTTLPALLLFGLALAAMTRLPPSARARWLYRLTPLLVFSLVYWIFAITSHLNIGQRHLLPLYPAWFILAGVVGSGVVAARARWVGPVAAMLLAWHAVESWRVRPHYLTYFNELAGGPTGGHRYFVDSSLDWGQGLPDLKTWLDAHPHDGPLYLSYFGSDDPLRYGIAATRIGDLYFDFAPRQLMPRMTRGLYCISATMLHRVYTQVRGPWTDAYEQAYEVLARDIVAPPDHRRCTPDELETFDQLRFGRLCLLLQHRPPDAIVGNTFFIYRLSDREVTTALTAPWREVAAAQRTND